MRSDAASPHVLVIAGEHQARLELEISLPHDVPVRSVRSASDTEGVGTKVVVIGGDFPLAELTEVRVHPNLFDKPVVLFAPSKALPRMDWTSLGVWPVTTDTDAVGLLGHHVQRLMSEPALLSEPTENSNVIALPAAP